MLEGKCPKCEGCYRGWALINPRHQSCPRCGVGLEITDGDRVFSGYSPFTAEKLPTNLSGDKPLSPDKKEEGKRGRKKLDHYGSPN
ncbi:hypothetical protein ACFLYR_02740 [Chloroflexota bacterium]